MAASSGAGVTDGLRLVERRFTVHRSARRRDGGSAAGRATASDDKCRLGYGR